MVVTVVTTAVTTLPTIEISTIEIPDTDIGYQGSKSYKNQ